MSAHDDVALTDGEKLKLDLMAEHEYIDDVMRDVAEEHARKHPEHREH